MGVTRGASDISRLLGLAKLQSDAGVDHPRYAADFVAEKTSKIYDFGSGSHFDID